MYLRSERPLTDCERERLNDRLRGANESVSDAAFKVVVLALFDGLALFAAVMAALGRDRSGTAGMLAGAAATVVANMVLLWNVLAFRSGRRERRELRQALGDGAAVVEQVEASAAATLSGAGRAWHVFAVGEGRLLALPHTRVPLLFTPGDRPESSGRLPACFEVVTTRPGRLHLGTVVRGLASLPLPPPTDLADITGPDENRQLALRLEAAPLFAGRLERLPEALARLLQEPPVEGRPAPYAGGNPPGPPGSATPWPLVQARVEERFGIAFGPGGLAAELARLAEAHRGPLTAGDLLELVRRRLPAAGGLPVVPVRPTFYKLRAALAAECGVPRRRVRPSARLEDLVPRQKRADRWAGLSRRLGLPLPPFAECDTPASVGVAGTAGMLLLYAVGVPATQRIDAYAAAHGFGGAWWYMALGACLVPTFFVGGIVLSFALPAYLFRNRYPLRFRAGCATEGELARALAEAGGAEGVVAPWTEAVAWQVLRGVLAASAGRRPSEVGRGTRLVEGLGLSPPARGPGD